MAEVRLTILNKSWAQVTVRVVDVLPNQICSSKARAKRRSVRKQNVVLHGIVRAEDVTANNTVFSYNVCRRKNPNRDQRRD